MVVVRMEQQCRRGQPWRRWKNSDDSPLPRLDWTDGEVEKVEETTARLLMDWATRFRGGERARWWQCTVGNGGRLRWLGAARREGERGKWSGERVRAGAGSLLERGRTTWSPRQSLRATRRASPEPVGHDGH